MSSREEAQGLIVRYRTADLDAVLGAVTERWDEVLGPGLARETVIQSWRGQASLAEAAVRQLNEELEQRIVERTAKLRESEEKHRTLFETMAQGVVYQAADGRITSANPAAERMFGYSAAETIGQEVGMLMPSPFREERDQYIDMADELVDRVKAIKQKKMESPAPTS